MPLGRVPRLVNLKSGHNRRAIWNLPRIGPLRARARSPFYPRLTVDGKAGSDRTRSVIQDPAINQPRGRCPRARRSAAKELFRWNYYPWPYYLRCVDLLRFRHIARSAPGYKHCSTLSRLRKPGYDNREETTLRTLSTLEGDSAARAIVIRIRKLEEFPDFSAWKNMNAERD